MFKGTKGLVNLIESDWMLWVCDFVAASGPLRNISVLSPKVIEQRMTNPSHIAASSESAEVFRLQSMTSSLL